MHGHDGKLTLIIQAREAQGFEIRILDMQGRLLIFQKAVLRKGGNTIAVAGLDQLAAGIYLMEIVSGSRRETVTIAVVK